MQNKVILCIGSNVDCEANVALARNQLEQLFGNIRFSEAVYTDPVGFASSSLFLNQVAVADTKMTQVEVNGCFKRIEKMAGRTADSKRLGIIPLDIDLLQWNDQIIKQEDMERDYVIRGLRCLYLVD